MLYVSLMKPAETEVINVALYFEHSYMYYGVSILNSPVDEESIQEIRDSFFLKWFPQAYPKVTREKESIIIINVT